VRASWLLLGGLVLVVLLHPAVAQNNATAAPSATGDGINAGRLLLTLAAIIGLGFAGFLVFDRFRIADTIFLIGFGILLSYYGFLDANLFRSFQPLIAVFAVLIIMFDSGLDLRFGDLAIPKMGWAIVWSTLGFLLCLGLVAALVHYVLALPWLLALILGAAVTDTAGLVILPILGQLGVPGKVKTALLVETSLPDVYAITLVIVLINVIQPQQAASDWGSTTGSIVGGFTTTLLIGAIAGALWIRALGWLATRRYAYMTTLAAILALNWIVAAVGGSGPVAVLVFGLLIGNRALLGKWSDVGRQKVFRDMTQFNGEVAFLVRSFFFVYLGVILDVRLLTTKFILVSLLIVAAIVVARALAVYIMAPLSAGMSNYRGLLIAAIPRGTTAAVVSTLATTRKIPGTQDFPAYAVAVILVTNLLFTIGLYLFFRGATKPAKQEADAAGD
jgi:cell volume regulation protein A